MPKSLLELQYLTLSGFAKARGCSEEAILHRGIAGQVKICALGNYWTLQEGYFSDDAPEGFPVPTKERGSGLKPIPLTCHALRKILSDGEVTDPEFIFEADSTQDQSDSSAQYEQFLSSVVISNDMEIARGKVIVKKADLVIRKEDADAFLLAYTKQDHEISKDFTMPENKAKLPIAIAVKPKKQKRHSELHDLIGKIIIELGFKNQKAPSLKIWSHIQKQQEKYECIRGVNDREIDWMSYRGFPQIMKRERFNTVVSEYNTGKRPYPEN